MALLDVTQVDSMATGATEMFLEIAERFLVSSRESLASLESLGPEDSRLAAGIVHQLKGASSTLGLAEFHQRMATCEENLRRGEVPVAGELQALRQLLEESVEAVKTHLAGMAQD